MFESPIVDFEPGEGRLDLRQLPILVDPEEHESVHIAVANLAQDLERVTGFRPPVWSSVVEQVPGEGVILVGSLEKSKFLKDLAQEGSSGIDQIRGKWESFHTSLQPCLWPAARRMLVIAGSDKRGTIFGVYTLSEQIGVSPWYWWADVPIQRHEHVYALPVATCQGEPSVQYRGLFINDEAPALTDWVHEKIGPCYNADFYRKYFELLLRMKANFFWPAMWSGYPEPGSSFFADDPRNQQVADSYGVVVSTSHHEPMQRSTTEWRRNGNGPWAWESNRDEITRFFSAGAERSQPYESIFTLGMRGEGDGQIQSENPKDTLKDVIETQRRIIKETYGKEDGVGQVMALYKEVQMYYEDGLEIPEDVTLLFADDNFGNVRRLPTIAERARSGGIGLYYHLEYVGAPRSYKWLSTTTCGKIQQQLSTAHRNGISKVWIFNVGDIKPIELASTLALALAWDINSVTATTIEEFFLAYARREFGPEHAGDVAPLLAGWDRMLALRRHEHIEPETFSILNYDEADRVLKKWKDLDNRAASLFTSIPSSPKAAFFQLVHHPIKASRICTELRITQAKNNLYGLQRRNTTNALAQHVLQLFDDDWATSEEYHNNPWSGNKWNHLMKQTHYGYVPGQWRAPYRDLITGISFIQKRQDSNRICGQIGVAVEGHAGVRPGLINEESDRTHPSRGDLVPGLTLPPLTPYSIQSRYFELYSRGTPVVEWVASLEQPWVSISPSSGSVRPDDKQDQRIVVTVNWTKVPEGFDDMIIIHIRCRTGEYEHVYLPVINHRTPSTFSGFVESDGYIAWEPAALQPSCMPQRDYQVYPRVGRADAGAIGVSPTAQGDEAWLDFTVYFFTHVSEISVFLYFPIVLETSPERMHSYDVSFDQIEERDVPLLTTSSKGELPAGWSTAVQDGVWVRKHIFRGAGKGAHRVRYRPSNHHLLLEKIVVDLGGVRDSYLGPPTSYLV